MISPSICMARSRGPTAGPEGDPEVTISDGFGLRAQGIVGIVGLKPSRGRRMALPPAACVNPEQ